MSDASHPRYGSSFPTPDPVHTAEGRVCRAPSSFLGRASSQTNERSSPRAISLGSIDELRSNAYTSTKQRVFSMTSIPSRRSSLVSASHTSSSRQSPRPVTLCDPSEVRKLSERHKNPLCIDLQEGHQVDFVFPPSARGCHDITQPRPLMNLKAKPYRSLSQNMSAPLLVRGSCLQQNQQKVPLFVPSMIVKPVVDKPYNPDRLASIPTTNLALSVGDAAEDLYLSRKGARSLEILSEASDWSITGQFGASTSEINLSSSVRESNGAVQHGQASTIGQGCTSRLETEAGFMQLGVGHSVDVDEDGTSTGTQGASDKGESRLRHLYSSMVDRVRKALSSKV